MTSIVKLERDRQVEHALERVKSAEHALACAKKLLTEFQEDETKPQSWGLLEIGSETMAAALACRAAAVSIDLQGALDAVSSAQRRKAALGNGALASGAMLGESRTSAR